MNQSNHSELAKSGDINAINNLVNQWLHSPSITVKTTLKQDCLQIMLESATVPEKESIISCIRDNLLNLSIDSVKKVKIYAGEAGEDFPDWQEELELNYTLTEQKTESQLSTQQPSFFNSFFGAIAGTAEAVGGAALGVSGAVGGAVGGAVMSVGGAVGGAAMGVGGAVGSAAMGVGGAVADAAMGVGGAVGSAAIGLGGAVGGAAIQATQVVGQALAIVGNNPVLQTAIKSLNQDWLNSLIDQIDQVDVVKAKAAVRKLQQEYPNEKPPEIAHRLMLEKSVLAGTSGVFAADYVKTAALSAELVYQIAAAYEMDLQDSERKGEVVAIFGLGLGGKTALQKTALHLLRNIPVAGTVIGASSNALMTYVLGYAACQFYEAKQNPLSLEATLVDAQKESEKYLEVAISQTKIMDQILVHLVLAGNPDKSWEDILPELKAANLSPASLDEIAAHIKSPPPLAQLLEQLNSDFAFALLAQCEKIANLDGVITPQEAQVIAAIRKRFNYQVV